MLRKETVTKPTLDILKKLMKDEALKDFVLVRGTALSLRIGHRISIDVDMFITKDFDHSKLNEYLQDAYGFSADYIERNTLKGNVNNVALDFIAHKYDLVSKVSEIEGIRLAGLNYLAAMKLNAIINNGTRIKDFVDVAFLGEHLTFKQMVNAYETKYKANSLMVPKALLYHKDIDHKIKIDLLPMAYNFETIQNSLDSMVKHPNQTHYLINKNR